MSSIHLNNVDDLYEDTFRSSSGDGTSSIRVLKTGSFKSSSNRPSYSKVKTIPVREIYMSSLQRNNRSFESSLKVKDTHGSFSYKVFSTNLPLSIDHITSMLSTLQSPFDDIGFSSDEYIYEAVNSRELTLTYIDSSKIINGTLQKYVANVQFDPEDNLIFIGNKHNIQINDTIFTYIYYYGYNNYEEIFMYPTIFTDVEAPISTLSNAIYRNGGLDFQFFIFENNHFSFYLGLVKIEPSLSTSYTNIKNFLMTRSTIQGTRSLNTSRNFEFTSNELQETQHIINVFLTEAFNDMSLDTSVNPSLPIDPEQHYYVILYVVDEYGNENVSILNHVDENDISIPLTILRQNITITPQSDYNNIVKANVDIHNYINFTYYTALFTTDTISDTDIILFFKNESPPMYINTSTGNTDLNIDVQYTHAYSDTSTYSVIIPSTTYHTYLLIVNNDTNHDVLIKSDDSIILLEYVNTINIGSITENSIQLSFDLSHPLQPLQEYRYYSYIFDTLYTDDTQIISVLKGLTPTYVTGDFTSDFQIQSTYTAVNGDVATTENIIPGRTYYVYLLTVRGDQEILINQSIYIPDNTDPVISDVALQAYPTDKTKLTLHATISDTSENFAYYILATTQGLFTGGIGGSVIIENHQIREQTTTTNSVDLTIDFDEVYNGSTNLSIDTYTTSYDVYIYVQDSSNNDKLQKLTFTNSAIRTHSITINAQSGYDDRIEATADFQNYPDFTYYTALFTIGTVGTIDDKQYSSIL